MRSVMSESEKEVSVPAAEVPNRDLPEALRKVANEYGREMFALVMGAGMASQAMEVLGELVRKHSSRHGSHALVVFGESFNNLSDAYAREKGWDAEQLAKCQQAVQMAVASQLTLPDGSLVREH